MTNSQKNAIDQITKRIEKWNGSQTVSVYNVRKGHVLLWIGNVKDNTDFIRTTTFCDIQINTKGNKVKGFLNYLTPKTKTKCPYMD